MALINCKECGKEISDKAFTCPHCGIKLKRPVYAFLLLSISLTIGIAGFIFGDRVWNALLGVILGKIGFMSSIIFWDDIFTLDSQKEQSARWKLFIHFNQIVFIIFLILTFSIVFE